MVAPRTLAKAERKHVFFRDVREHHKIEMEKRLKEYNWTSVNNTRDASEAVSILTDAIGGMYNDCFPLAKVKVSFMGISPERQEKINILIRENQIRAVKAENRKFKRGSKECWRTVNKITGRSINVDRVSTVIDPGQMNEYF
jgi:hypothetical protein